MLRFYQEKVNRKFNMTILYIYISKMSFEYIFVFDFLFFNKLIIVINNIN